MRNFAREKVIVRTVLAAGLALAATAPGRAAEKPAKKCVVVWSEGTAPKNIYPQDINGAIAEGLREKLKNWEVVTASLGDPDQGLPDALLNRADVLIWWGHKRHGDVKDERVAQIVRRVKEDGMGFISLHSSHFAKANLRLMDTPCTWGAYVADSKTSRITVLDAKHPIAKKVSKEFTIANGERYNDPYAVPEAEAVVFDGEFTLADGKTLRSKQGFCWTIGKGRMFYFQPGHETNPIYFDKDVRTIMANAVRWAADAK